MDGKVALVHNDMLTSVDSTPEPEPAPEPVPAPEPEPEPTPEPEPKDQGEEPIDEHEVEGIVVGYNINSITIQVEDEQAPEESGGLDFEETGLTNDDLVTGLSRRFGPFRPR